MNAPEKILPKHKNVYAKLQEARVRLQSMPMKKSGHNKFAGYQYFELGDFLPTINTLFAELGLCSTVSYSVDLATLRIVDIDTSAEIIFTSPMSEANLKGCHPIQNLGAVETYQRRYLYVTALEIVEHDALDSASPLDSVADKAIAQQRAAEATKQATQATADATLLAQYRSAAMNGGASLKAFHGIAKGESKARVWAAHSVSLKKAADEADLITA